MRLFRTGCMAALVAVTGIIAAASAATQVKMGNKLWCCHYSARL